MRNKLVTYFYRDVVSSYKDFVSSLESGSIGDGRTLNLGKLGAHEINHFRDKMSKPYNDFYFLKNECFEYAITNDVSNVLKHHEIEARRFDVKPNRWIPTLRYEHQVREVLIVNKYQDELGEYEHNEKDIVLWSDNIPNKSLFYTLTATINYWGSVLKKMNLIDEPTIFTYKSINGYINREDAKKITLGTLSFNFNSEVEIIIRNFDPQSGLLIMSQKPFVRRISLECAEDGSMRIHSDTDDNVKIRLTEVKTGRVMPGSDL